MKIIVDGEVIGEVAVPINKVFIDNGRGINILNMLPTDDLIITWEVTSTHMMMPESVVLSQLVIEEPELEDDEDIEDEEEDDESESTGTEEAFPEKEEAPQTEDVASTEIFSFNPSN